MIDAIQSLVRSTDAMIARIYLALFRERDALMTFLFHSLMRDESENAQHLVDPGQQTTVAQFRQLVEYYLEHGYQFISPDDLLAGLGSGGRYAMLTFDDGYYNNVLALPVLEELRVPAVFFVSTNHIAQNKSFWWDALYRELSARGISEPSIYRSALSMKTQRTAQIEAELIARFGPDALRPRSDVDRPFSPAELREFAGSPHVRIGNHTANHAILTNYSPEEVRDQILGAQEALRAMTGINPSVIAYPNGAHSRKILQTCDDIGLKVGFTIRPTKDFLPLDTHSSRLLRLGRFVPHSGDTMESQCRTYRSDLLLYGKFRDGYLRFLRGNTAS